MKTFTKEPEKPTIPEETVIKMYAAWGRFIDLSREFIPWDKFINILTPEVEVLGEDEGGNLICQTTIRLQFQQKKPQENAKSAQNP